MSFTASQTNLHLADNASFTRISQCYDSTPKSLKNGAVQPGGLAERVATLYLKLLHADATMWFRSLSDDKVKNYFGKPAARVSPDEYVSIYGDFLKNTVEFERITDVRQSCSFFEKFVPTMVCVTSWTIVQGSSQESRSNSVPLEISFAVGSDFISDIIATVSDVPPQIQFQNPVPKADAPYIRKARDYVPLTVDRITFGTRGIENKLYEDTGYGIMASMEMRTADKYHLGQRVLGNQEVKFASMGCNVYGIDEEDRIDRKLVYTDGAQTSQPLYDSMFYRDDGISGNTMVAGSGAPIRQYTPIPLMSTFANDKQAVQSIYIGSAVQMVLNVNLKNLDLMYVLEGRGASLDPINGVTLPYRSINMIPTVNMTMSYRYGLLPSYLQVILASSSSINLITNNRINSAPLKSGKVTFATKTPVAYLATFAMMNRTGLNKLLPVERAEKWSSMSALKKRVKTGPTALKFVPLQDVKSAFVEDNSLILVSTSTSITAYAGPSIQAGSRVRLVRKATGAHYNTFTLGADLLAAAPMLTANPVAIGSTPTLALAALSGSIVPVETLPAATLSPELDIFVEQQIPTKVTVFEENDIIKEQQIEYSGASVRIIEAIDNATLCARSLNTKSHSAPHRRGMYVHSFCTEAVGSNNRESGYILPVVGTDAAFTFAPSDFVDQAGLVDDYDVHVVVGSRNIVQSKAGMIHPKFVG